MTTPTRPRPDHDPDVTAPSRPGTARTRRVRPAPCGVRKAPRGVGRRGRSDGGEAAGSRCGPCYPNNVIADCHDSRAGAGVRRRSRPHHGATVSAQDHRRARAEPLKLAAFAVNRRTQSGRVAGPEQRISVDAALRVVTIDAAYSLRQEHELGGIAPGKRATFTVPAPAPTRLTPKTSVTSPCAASSSWASGCPCPIEARRRADTRCQVSWVVLASLSLMRTTVARVTRRVIWSPRAGS